MQNILESFSQATLLWNNVLGTNASKAMDSLSGISSYGPLHTSGFTNPVFSHSSGGKAVCVSGIIDVPVLATTVDVLYKGPAKQLRTHRIHHQFRPPRQRHLYH